MRFRKAQPWVQAEQPEQQTEKATPTRPADPIADLAVPLGQAGATGIMLATVVVFLLSRTNYTGDIGALWVGLVLGISSLAWLLLLLDTRALLRTLETVTGKDLNRDGKVGKERVVFVNAEPARQQAKAQREGERQSQFARFVSGIPIKGTALRAWESELGRETYQEYRDSMIRLGWARWNSTKADGTPNETQGWELVKPAEWILQRVDG